MPELVLQIAGIPTTSLMDRAGHRGLWAGSLEVSHLADHRATMQFKLLTQHAVFVPRFGQVVELFDPDGTKVFGGTVDEVTERMRVGGSDLTADLEVTCPCTDWNQYLDTLYMDAVFIGGTAGNAILRTFGFFLIAEPDVRSFFPCPSLVDEGFTVAESDIADGATLTTEIFDRATVSQFLGRMAELSQDGAGNSYIWYVDPAKRLYFGPRSIVPAPFGLTDAGGEIVADSFELTHTRKDYANEVFLRFAAETAEDTMQYTGDNVSRFFPRVDVDPPDPVLRPIREVVRIDLNGIEQTAGLEPESQNPGADWYWHPGGTTIFQSDAAPAAISTSDVLTVVTHAFGADLIGAVNEEQVTAYAARRVTTTASGGSGKLQLLIERTDLTDAATIQATVDAALARTSKPGKKIRFQTYRAGLMPGQLLPVTLGGHNLIGEEFAIDQVDIRDEDGIRLVYTVTAHLAAAVRVRGAVDFFQSLDGGGGIIGGGAAGGFYEIVVIQPGALAVGNDFATHYPVRRGGALVEWSATSKTTPTGPVILDIRLNNMSIFEAAQRPTIPAGQNPLTAVVGTAFVSPALRVGDIVTADCIATEGARGVTLKLKVRL